MTFEARARIRGCALILLAAFMFLEWLPWMIQDRVWPDGSSGAREWTFWLQTVSGNWSPPDVPPVTHLQYAVSAVLAFLINNATFLALITFIWRLSHLRKREMRMNQAFTARDQMNKQVLYRNLASLGPGTNESDIRKKIDESFEEGKTRWRAHLIKVFGHNEASKLFDLLETTI